jgi:hypothetical protein
LKRLFAYFALFILLFTTTACSRIYQSKADYFKGSVYVEYLTNSRSGTNDNISLTFYDKGVYDVVFTYTKGTEKSIYNSGKATLPENFSITIENSPRTRVITQYVLPGFLTVSITRNGTTETHDFQ